MVEPAAAPQQPAAYRLVAADELGVLKVVEVPVGPKWDAAAVVTQWGTANKAAAVQKLACSAASLEPGTPAVLAVGRKGGRVDILDPCTGTQQCTLTAAAAGGKAKPASTTAVVALEFVPATDDCPLQLLVGTSDGMVSVCCSSSSADDASADDPSSSGASWSVARSFAVGTTLSCLAIDAAGTHIVVGGEGMQPSLWDLSTGSKVWQGKGGKPNRVGLVDKPFPTAAAFLPSSSYLAAAAEAGTSGRDEEGPSISRRFVIGSAVAKLHVYDTAAGKRPQQEAVFGESRVTALAVTPDGQRVWAASGTGHMQLWVLKTNKLQDALKGAGGSVRALALYPRPEPWLASAGLDRFLRVHDASSKAGKARVYLKQQLSAVVWLPVLPRAPAAAAVGEQEHAGDGVAQAAGSSRKKQKGSESKGGRHRQGAGDGEGADGEGQGDVPAEQQQSKKRRKHNKVDVSD